MKHGKSAYINRELSWLKFNERVLEEAESADTPLFERLRFVAIFNSNLDEFFMIRVGSLYDRSLVKVKRDDDKTGMSAAEQLTAVFNCTAPLLARRDRAYHNIMKSFAKIGVHHIDLNKLSPKQISRVKSIFESDYHPLLAPQIIDNKHPFPHLTNREIYVGVLLKSKTKSTRHFGLIPVTNIPERVVLRKNKEEVQWFTSEQLIEFFAPAIYDIYTVVNSTIFRVTRNADIDVNEGLYDEDPDYRELMKKLIKKRNKQSAVRLELSSETCKELKEFLITKIGVASEQVFICNSPLDLTFIEKYDIFSNNDFYNDIYYPQVIPQPNPAFNEREPIMKQLLKKDVLLHVPYESMQPIVSLLREAAFSKNVISIKITLYRLARESKIIDALITAAENGKQVTAMVELKARFDESNNLGWSAKLEEAGCHILYGVNDYKVHSKLLLITRKDANTIRYVTYVGTGNFNETTAKIYSDLGLFTCDNAIAADAERFFRNLQLSDSHAGYSHLLVAPQTYKSRLMECIDNEIRCHQHNGNGRIICKFNSLTDKDFIDKFYEASAAGVKIDLIIRGICCLRSGVPELSENINVTSIVGRFLEHSRIFWFEHGVHDAPAVFIGSGDLMTRNTERRLEVAIPIYETAIQQTIRNILETALSDNVKARRLLPDGNYVYVSGNINQSIVSSQTEFYNRACDAAKNSKPKKKLFRNKVAGYLKKVSEFTDNLATRLSK